MSNEKDKNESFANDLNKSAHLLLRILFGVFIFGLIVMITSIIVKDCKETKEITLKIEEIKQVTKIPYLHGDKEWDNKLQKKYFIDGDLLDSLKKINTSLNDKILNIKNIEESVKEMEARNSDFFKLFLALIGSIFAIVGFFGFKSINDTRQAAIDSVKIKADETLKTIMPEKISNYVNEYLKGDAGSNIIKIASEEKAKNVAYDESSKVAKDTATDVLNSLKVDNNEYRIAINEDFRQLKYDNRILLRRIQDLELELYGIPDDEDVNQNDIGIEDQENQEPTIDNQPVV